MNIPDLLHSLTIDGLKMELGPDDTIDITGPIDKLTEEQRQSVRENRPEIVELLGCFTKLKAEPKPESFEPPSELNCGVECPEDLERKGIQSQDTAEARLQAIKVGEEFILMAAQDHHTWLWNRIGEQKTLDDLLAFAQRFEKDVETYEVYRPIADDIRELIVNRQALLTAMSNSEAEKELYNRLSNKVAAIKSICSLETFESEFNLCARRFDEYRNIERQIRALINFGRRWIEIQPNPTDDDSSDPTYTEKANSPDASTSELF